MRRLLTGTLGLALAVLAACGEGTSTSNPPAPAKGDVAAYVPPGTPEAVMIANAPKFDFAPTRADATPWSAQDGASVKGVAVLAAGKPATRKKIKFDKDPKCENEDAREEKEIVDKESLGIKNVFVVVVAGHEAMKFEVPKQAEKLHQKGCMYEPHVFGVMPGQEIQIVNDDDTMHNVHGVPVKSKEFNFPQATKGAVDSIKIDNAENAVPIKCDVHPWMSAYAFVVPHRLFAVSDAKGAFELKGLKDGGYTVLAWHETYGEMKQDLKVEGGKAADLKFDFKK
jgi:plastocyanin